MMLFLSSFVIILLAILGLGTGLLLGRGPLPGSCGGDGVIDTCALCARKEAG